MASYTTEEVACGDLREGDWISLDGGRNCSLLVLGIQQGALHGGKLPARRLTLGNEQETLYVRDFGLTKKLRRRVRTS